MVSNGTVDHGNNALTLTELTLGPNAGRLQGTADVTVSGVLDFGVNAELVGSGTVTANGPLLFSGNGGLAGRTLVSNGTVDKAAYAALPPAPSGALTFPTQAQDAAAEAAVTADWAKDVG